MEFVIEYAVIEYQNQCLKDPKSLVWKRYEGCYPFQKEDQAMSKRYMLSLEDPTKYFIVKKIKN